MRYALIIAGYALILWGILSVRREAGRGRAASYRDGQAEVEAVVAEFVAAAERVRSELERKSADLQRLINLADDRLAKLIQAQTPVSPAPAPAPATAPARAKTEIPTVAPAAVAAASYRAQAVGHNSGAAEETGGTHETQSVRAALTGQDKGTRTAEQESGRTEPGEKKARRDRSRHAEVYGLADSGQGVTEIARVSGLSKGEVQLILDLRKTR